jgi:hypothetical protein
MPRCKQCKISFQQVRALQQVCSPTCGIALAHAKRVNKDKKEYNAVTKEKKKKLKTRADYLRECQVVFNLFIRLRDHIEPCISCCRHHTGQYHAGHYLSIGSHPWLRFNELNTFKQCCACNNKLSGNILNYRKNLIQKFGIEFVERLESNQETEKLTTDEIVSLTSMYKAKAKELKAAIECSF